MSSPAEETKPRVIDQQNRVALTQEVLEALGAKRGDYVIFRIERGEVKVRKAKWVVE